MVSVLFAILLACVFEPVVLEGRTFAPNGVVRSQSGQPEVDFPYETPSRSVVNDQGAFAHLFEPWARLVHAAYADGAAPLWNPRSGLGQPLAANFQSGVGSPLYVPVLIRPSQGGWDLVILLRLLVGGVGCYVLLRTLGAGGPAAFVAAVGYLIAPAFVLWAGSVSLSVEAWAPWVLVATRSIVRGESTVAFCGLALVTAAAVFGGQPEVLVALFYFAAAWTLYWWLHYRPGWRRFAEVGAAAVVGALLAAPQLLLGAEYVSHAYDAHRGRLGSTSPPFERLKVVLLGDFHYRYYASLAICTVVLAVAGVAARRASGVGGIGFAIGAAAVYVVRAYDLPGSNIVALLPGIAAINAPRYGFFLVALSSAILTAAGVQALLRASRRAAVAATLAAAIPVLLWPGGGLAKRALLFGLLMAATAWAIRARPMLAPAAAGILVLQFFALAPRTYAQRYDPFEPRPFARWLIANVGDGERVAATREILHPLYSAALGLSDPRTADALQPDRYARYVEKALRACMCGNFGAKLQLWHAPSPFLDALGVRYLVTPSSGRPRGEYTLAWHGTAGSRTDLVIWRNERALPHAWIPTSVVSAANIDEAETLLQRGDANLRARSVVEGPTPEMQTASGVGSVVVDEIGWNTTSMRVHATGRVTVVTSATFYPGWRATVDGTESPIRPANLVMRAVSVPSGDHTLTFTYSPRPLRYGAILSTLGLVLLILRPIAGASRFRRKSGAAANGRY